MKNINALDNPAKSMEYTAFISNVLT